ncbi:MAG TPA: hypothetical protein P5528_09870, partial [Steroidobacteraceae bacterium]|nr:hypothetical protein [Steroidobacteraceae bacterium]
MAAIALQMPRSLRQPIRAPARHLCALLAMLSQLLWPMGARADVEVEVRGVADNIRSNVLAFLSIELYKQAYEEERLYVAADIVRNNVLAFL